MAEPASDRVRVRRLPERGRYDMATVHAILDEGLVAHVGVVVDGAPRVLTLAYGRDGDVVYLHGSSGSRTLMGLRDGGEVCLSVTLVDGLVLARSGFHHSMNYRSVVAYGTLRELVDDAERRRALDLLVDAVVPGRAATLRPPSRRELAATVVYALPLDEVSAKVRTGPPVEEPEDLTWPAWAGVVPLALTPGPAEADEHVPTSLPAPPGVAHYRRRP